MFVESHTGQGFSVVLKMYAHRSLPQLMVTEVFIQNDQNKTLQVNLNSGTANVTDFDDLDKKLSGDRTSPSEDVG